MDRGTSTPQPANLSVVEGDIMTYPFPLASFDFISVVATLHHLPLGEALRRFRELLKPDGVLAVIGLYRPVTVTDGIFAAAGLPMSWLFCSVRGCAPVQARLQRPAETLTEIRRAADAVLPGAILKRQLLFRYSLMWRRLTPGAQV